MSAFPDQMLQTFLAEARDHVRDLEAGLQQLGEGQHDADLIGGLFRAAHSIKGSGGMFGLAPLVGFTHRVESVLDRMRGGALATTAPLVRVLQDSCDHIADLIEVLVARNGALDDALQARDAQLRAALEPHGAGPAHEAAVAAPAALPDTPTGCWHLSIRFGRDVFRQGINPLSFIRELAELGEIVHIAPLIEQMPAAEAVDAEDCHLGFEIDLRSNATRTRIAEVFEFVEDSSVIHILPPHSRVEAFIELIEAMPEPDARLGEILVHAGTLTRAELQRGLDEQRTRARTVDEPPPLGAVLVEQQVLAPEVVQAALDKQARMRTAPTTGDTGWVRVRADKLDELINLVGELVIAGAGAALIADCSGNTPLLEAQAGVSRLVEDIRDRALRLRMVPIGETFSRFHRVLREVGREIGKEIELVVEGGETELDKSMVEKLSDPLVHLIRNAADHGIEPPAVRTARGKPERGRIRLSAAHESGCIRIQIADDGAGMDRERILAKARERGLVPPGHTPAEHEILQLIFEPGFSTAQAVTNISGRGVGMDVVRRSIHALRGSIALDSVPGQGSTITIQLPLTLAIIEGFLVGVGDTRFVLPLERVVECVEPPAGAACAGYLDLRGHPLPLMRLRDQLAIAGPRARRENVVVVDTGQGRAGLVVDTLLGEMQTVIKPLGALFAGLRGISGSTILGTGEVALILDVPMLAEQAMRSETSHVRAPAGAGGTRFPTSPEVSPC